MLDFNQRIFVGVTFTSSRRKKDHWKEQLNEINRLNIKQITLFPTTLNKKQRQILYQELEKSSIEEIKLVHLRGQDFEENELNYFYKRFKTRLFNCHEKEFDKFYKKFFRFHKNILLELDYNNKIENKLKPNKMGGFCIDLAHLMAARDNLDIEYLYVLKHLEDTEFQANHLGGYSKTKKKDIHFVTNKNQFNYLK